MARKIKPSKIYPPGLKGSILSILTGGGSGIVIALKLVLLSPLLLGMVWVNYSVDRSGLFHTDRYETEVALSLIGGKNLSGYDQMNERQLYQLVSENLETPYDTIALGSSRVLGLRQEAVGGSFLNCGMSNADYRDILSTYYLFEKAGMKPKNLILCIDPGLLYNNSAVLHPYSNADLYNEFLTLKLGFDAGYEAPAEEGVNKALYDPSYFQANIEYYVSNEDSIPTPGTIDSNLYTQPANVKLGDGSVLYSQPYRDANAAEVHERAVTDLAWLGRLFGYQDLDPGLLKVFNRFFEYAKSQDVNIIFLFVPFYPLAYDYATENFNVMSGFFKIEDWIREYAHKNGLALYGTYNPYVGDGFSEKDYYDGLHILPESMAKIFPGIQQVEQDIQNGSPTSLVPKDGKVVNLETATRIVANRYEVFPPEVLRPIEDEDPLVDGYKSIILGRYQTMDEGATLLARYAVTIEEGTIYRFDDQKGWVIDYRFTTQ